MPEVKIEGNLGQVIELRGRGKPGMGVNTILVALTANCPDNIQQRIQQWGALIPESETAQAASLVANELVGHGWGIIVEVEQCSFNVGA